MLCAAGRPAALGPKATTRVVARRSVVVKASSEQINPSINKDVDKVVDTVAPSDLGGKPQAAYCRCWRSEKFPLCDGGHMKHNKATGDNVGPLLVKSSD